MRSHFRFPVRSLVTSTAIGLLSLLGTHAAHAQAGKVSAKIVDANSGEPIIRATLVILETKQGAYSKDNGVATIINVAPSENYTVVAKYAEYTPDTLRHVKVQSDITTSLSFKLGQKNKVIVVTGQSKMVEVTKTDIATKYSSTAIQSIPARQRLDEVIKLTPGAVQDNAGGGISFNGSRGTSNSTRFNGIEITDPMTGKTTGTLQSSISRLAISEVNIVTGSADASKGGFTGGSINTQTAAGGNQLAFTAHYRTEVPSLFGTSSNGFKQMAAGDNVYEFSLSGPLVEDLKYDITAKLNAFKYYNVFSDPVQSNSGLGVTDPIGNNAGQLPHTSRYRRSTTGKFTYNAFGFSIAGDVALSSESDLLNSVGLLYMDPYYLPAQNYINNIYSLKLSGQVGEGVLEIQGGYTIYDFQLGKYDQSSPVDAFHSPHFLSVEDKYTYSEEDQSVTSGADGIIDIYTPVSRQIPDPADPTKPYGTTLQGINPFTGHIEGPGLIHTSNNAYGLVQFFPTAGNVFGFSISNTNQKQFSAQYSLPMGAHQLSAGVEGHLFKVYQYDNGLPWDANPFKDSFQVHPYWGDVFIQDKMEFSDITFQPGLRFDVYQPDTKTINDVYNPIKAGLTQSALQSQITPRLSITYAVTDQTTFNFAYNWNFKQPTLNNVLNGTGGGDLEQIRRQLIRGNSLIGNGSLNAERTKEVDVGFNTQLSDIFALSVNAIYKDLRNNAGLQFISSPSLPSGFIYYSDDQYGTARSIQFIAEKRMSDNYSAKLTYTYGSAKGTSSSATENYAALISADPSSEQAVLPLTPFPFSYDRTHVANLMFTLNYNKDEGPVLFGTHPLQWFNLSTVTDYYTGTPYTRVDQRGGQVGATNGEREPDHFQTDLTLQRTIPFEDIFGESAKSLFLELQLEVTNVFNRTTAVSVFPSTGQGDNDGSTGQLGATNDYYNDPTNIHGGQLDDFGNLLYNSRIDFNHDGRVSPAEQQTSYTRFRKDRLNLRSNYEIPRRVFFNVTFRF